MTPSTERFSSRVEAYIRSRPGYPAAVCEVLGREIGFTTGSVVADIGSGTGLSTRLFLENGNDVFAVEPNAAMRQAAEAMLANNAGFQVSRARPSRRRWRAAAPTWSWPVRHFTGLMRGKACGNLHGS